jgi:hypothetical protein
VNSPRIAVLRALIRLPGCRSLKEKRGRVGGIRERYGRNPQLAVCETDHHDVHDLAAWAFIAAASSPVVVEQLLAEISSDLPMRVDGEVLSLAREWLS